MSIKQPSSPFSLEGRVAIVTGGSRGIGLGVARSFLEAGGTVVLAARDAGQLDQAAAALGPHDGRLSAMSADIGCERACGELVDRVMSAHGRIDILVNGAGKYVGKSFLDYSRDEIDDMLRINLHGPLTLMQLTLPIMKARGWGRIINIASTAGKWASRNQSVYNVSKHGLVGLTRCVGLETAGTGVTVNAICPGLVRTEMVDKLIDDQMAATGLPAERIESGLLARVPIGRLLESDECGHLALYLASEKAGGMTGQSLLLDGGMLFV